MIPTENAGFEDRGRAPESRGLLFLHISGRFCLCAPFLPSLFHCFWARPAGAGTARRPYTTSAQRPPKSHTQRLHNVIHNVRTTSTQRLHNVCTTFPGPFMADCFGKSTVLMVRAVCPSPVIARRALHNVRTTSPKSHTQRLHNVTHNVRTTSTQRPHNVPGADYK